MEWLQNVESHNVESQNVEEQNVEFTKCRIHIMSNAQNVEFTKCRISQEKSANFVFKNFAKLEEKIRKISRFKTLKNTCSCCAMMFSLFVSNISM